MFKRDDGDTRMTDSFRIEPTNHKPDGGVRLTAETIVRKPKGMKALSSDDCLAASVSPSGALAGSRTPESVLRQGPRRIGIRSLPLGLGAGQPDNLFVVSNFRMTFQRTLIIVAVLLCTSSGNHVAAQAQDFGFRFEVGDCLTERLDTFNSVFTKELGGWPVRVVTAQIALTDVQMTDIHQAIENIRFFDYPSKFVGVPSDARETVTTTAFYTYRMEVRNEGAVHTVVWKDAYKPTTAEADRLRRLFSMVQGFIHDHPEFKRLPPAVVNCMG
jgi:hypothetical protein